MKISALSTPCALVDLDTVESNTARMSRRIRQLGARLRPHVKTHKCLEGALLQHGGERGPITVSTMSEARHFFSHGYDDITYAVPIAPHHLVEVAELLGRGCRLNIILDSHDAIDAIEASASAAIFPTLLEFDCAYGRTGADPSSALALALARRLTESPRVDFRGVLTHAGHSYGCAGRDALRAAARSERDAAVAFATRLRSHGLVVEEVSVGSTPTASVVEDLEGVTEVRPGNYVFYDLTQAAIGSCEESDMAMSVLTTVVGVYPSRARIVVDAGALALSKDLGAGGGTKKDHTYGRVLNPASCAPIPGLKLETLSQEHGQIKVEGSFPDLRVGDRLRIAVNHSCLTAALHDTYHVVRGGQVLAQWRPIRGW